MTLRGNLESFSPSELLQFLSFSKKSGLLKIYDDQDSKFVEFKDGNLVYSVHQRPLPHLSELLVHSDDDQTVNPKSNKPSGWDEVVTRALARRRLLPHQRSALSRKAIKDLATESQTRLKALLLAQGKVEENTLTQALDPRTLPDNLLEETLKRQNLIPSSELYECIQSKRKDESVYECLTEQGILSPKQLEEAVEQAPDELLAEILVIRGVLTRADARACLTQLQSLQGQPSTRVRLGEYLVATGQITQIQFEKALVDQLDQDKLLGEILVDQGFVSPSEILRSIEEIENLRVDFGPLAPLRQKLCESHFISARDFSEAFESIQSTPQSLVKFFHQTGKVSESDFRSAVKTILTEEMGDVLIWKHAQFEFIEDLNLCDLLSSEEYCEVLEETFTIQQILLESHRLVDDLNRTMDEGFSLLSVLIPTDYSQQNATEISNSPQYSALKHFDGNRSLQKIRRVLSGNRFNHLKLFSDLLSEKWVRPLTRREAYLRGKNLLSKDQYQNAITLFRHAVRMPGDLPASDSIQTAIKDCKRSNKKRHLFSYFLNLLGLTEVEGNSSSPQGNRELESIGAKEQQAYEDALIRNGFSRFCWGIQHRVNAFFDHLLPRKMALPRNTAVAMSMLFLVALGMTHYGNQRFIKESEAIVYANSEGQKLETPSTVSQISSSTSIEIEAPITNPPNLHHSFLYVSSRDGYLRAFDLRDESIGSDQPQTSWEIKLGRFGDILSTPMIGNDHLFVTNLRGELYKISINGYLIWKRSIEKTDKFPPFYIPEIGDQEAQVITVSEFALQRYSAQSGKFLLSKTLPSSLSTELVFHGNVLVGGTQDGKLLGFNPETFDKAWSLNLKSPVTLLHVYEDLILVSTESNVSSAIDPTTGEQLWSRQNLRLIKTMKHHETPILVGIRDHEKLIHLNPKLGKEIFEAPLNPIFSLKKPTQVGEELFFSTENGFLGKLNLAGKVSWRSPSTKGEIKNWVSDQEFLIGNTQEGKLVLFKISDP